MIDESVEEVRLFSLLFGVYIGGAGGDHKYILSFALKKILYVGAPVHYNRIW